MSSMFRSITTKQARLTKNKVFTACETRLNISNLCSEGKIKEAIKMFKDARNKKVWNGKESNFKKKPIISDYETILFCYRDSIERIKAACKRSHLYMIPDKYHTLRALDIN